MIKHKTIPIFVSHMGCPNACSFCNQKKITGHDEIVTQKMAAQIIETSLRTMPKDARVEIGFFGGSFTGIEQHTQEALLSVAHRYVTDSSVDSIRISTRPDYINAEIIDMLKAYSVGTVELGAQSMDNAVLAANHRGHTCEDTVRASEMIRSAGLNLGLQMMTGLYTDTDETCLKSAEKIITLKPQCVRIYPTLVLKDTLLYTLYQSGKYEPQTLIDAVRLCADLKQLFDENNIAVIRMGLMASDHINPEKDVAAGPFHPAFGELVQSEIYFRRLKSAIHEDCTVYVNPKSYSAFLGLKKQNLTKLNQLGYRVQILCDETVSRGEFQLQL